MTDDDRTANAGPMSAGSAAVVFAGVWEALTDVLGSAAAATLLRRAIRDGRTHSPNLDALTIVREEFEYRYVVPPSWNTDSPLAMNDLQVLARQLTPLLTELTGPVVLHRLRALPHPGASTLFPSEEVDS